jgi:hypothetical protein
MNAETVTNDQVIERALALRDHIATAKKQFAVEILEYENALTACENYLLKVMQDRNEDNIKTSKGTAFKSKQMRVSMADRDAVIEYVIAHNRFDIFTNHVAKEVVKEIIEAEGRAPPGIDVQSFIACHIRKP